MSKLIIAHDLGTSGNKASVYNLRGELVAASTRAYDTHYFNGNWAEQNPADWWDAVSRSTRDVLEKVSPKDIAAVAFSGHMDGCLAVDGSGDPLHPHILWADQRAEEEAALIASQVEPATLFKDTGHMAAATAILAKILWLKKHKPDVYAKTHTFLSSKDYLVFKMTGQMFTEPSDASATLLFDINEGQWSSELASHFGVDMAKLPTVIESSAVAGTVTKDAARDTGLLVGTPVVMGGGDGCAASLGSGCVGADDVHISMGTSAWIMQTTDRPTNLVEDGTFTYCHVVPGMYSVTGTMQAAGSSYSWFSDIIGLDRERRQALEREMLMIDPGANGLMFLPYLMGERSPYWDPKLKGAFFGLKRETSKAEMMRAVLEGVAMHMAVIQEKLDPHSSQIRKLNAVGGGARSDLWCQILADVLQVPIHRLSRLEEAGGLGVAVLAGVGTELFSDFNVIHDFQTVEKTFEPNHEAASFYDSRLPLFKGAYELTRDLQAKLADGM
ncbi:MAG TPA: xylulokinase [Clostridiaceae bacterium]|nr:xylulokinase [Clostridiaceae bacterium]